MTTPKFLDTLERPVGHHLSLLVLGAGALLALRAPLGTLLALSLHDSSYSHILIVPLISFTLIYLERRVVFADLHFSPLLWPPFLLAGLLAHWTFRSASLNQSDRAFLIGCAIVLASLAGFAVCYGTRSFVVALFPLLFLFLMVPLPPVVIDQFILALQKGSAAVSYALFRVLGVPVLWNGFKFTLPGVEIEVAKECSGIRSCLSLVITAIVAGHIFLRSSWKKLLLGLLTVPIAIFKNAVRIVTLSCLGVYVDRSFLFGRLHRYGGLPFGLIALALLGPVLWMLYRSESRSHNASMDDSRPGIKIHQLPEELRP
jgi:exosortase